MSLLVYSGTYTLNIKVMPPIRRWKNCIMINSRPVNWTLIRSLQIFRGDCPEESCYSYNKKKGFLVLNQKRQLQLQQTRPVCCRLLLLLFRHILHRQHHPQRHLQSHCWNEKTQNCSQECAPRTRSPPTTTATTTTTGWSGTFGNRLWWGFASCWRSHWGKCSNFHKYFGYHEKSIHSRWMIPRYRGIILFSVYLAVWYIQYLNIYFFITFFLGLTVYKVYQDQNSIAKDIVP